MSFNTSTLRYSGKILSFAILTANQRKQDLKSKTIYLLRHGQTDLNLKGMVQGRGVNASLNKTGREQAIKAFNALRDTSFDSIYTSSLIRTHETVAPFLNNGLELISHAGFDEISWGNQEGKEATMESKNLYAETVNGWRNGQLSLNVGGGENPLQVMERQKEAMNVVMIDPGERILVCMHGRAMRILLCWLLKYPLNYMDGFPHDNCAYYQLISHNESFFVKRFNEVAHLQ